MKAITVEALSKTFSGGTVAVDGIRFSLNQGDFRVLRAKRSGKNHDRETALRYADPIEWQMSGAGN